MKMNMMNEKSPKYDINRLEMDTNIMYVKSASVWR